MRLPPNNTNLGRVLRAMINAGPMTSREVRKAARLPVDTAVTARIRDLRKMGIDVAAWSIPHPKDEHKRIWLYRIVRMPRAIRRALNEERKRQRPRAGWGVAA